MNSSQPSLIDRYALPPSEIEALSLQRVRGLVGEPGQWTADEVAVVHRMVYSAGDPDLAALVRFHPEAVERGVQALRRGRPVVVDVRMVEVGLDRARLERLGCFVRCAVAVVDDSNSAQPVRIPRAV